MKKQFKKVILSILTALFVVIAMNPYDVINFFGYEVSWRINKEHKIKIEQLMKITGPVQDSIRHWSVPLVEFKYPVSINMDYSDFVSISFYFKDTIDIPKYLPSANLLLSSTDFNILPKDAKPVELNSKDTITFKWHVSPFKMGSYYLRFEYPLEPNQNDSNYLEQLEYLDYVQKKIVPTSLDANIKVLTIWGVSERNLQLIKLLPWLISLILGDFAVSNKISKGIIKLFKPNFNKPKSTDKSE